MPGRRIRRQIGRGPYSRRHYAVLVRRIGLISFSNRFLGAFHLDRHNDAVANGALQGWHGDPFGRHEMRYFSAGRPTKLVRDGRLESYDEPPADAAAADGSAALPGGSDLADAARAFSSAGGSGTSWTPGTASLADGDAALESYRREAATVARRRLRRLEYSAVAVGAVIAVLVFVAFAGGSRSPGLSPAAFVTKAAQRTLSQSTADVTLSGTDQVSGQSLSFEGSGQVDFATNVMSLNVGASSSGASVTENELLVGGNIYLDVTADGHDLATLTGGRHWLEIPFAQSGSQTATNGSPASALSLLSQEGDRVTPLGPRNINGQTCNGYIVTPSRQAMLAGAKAELTKMGFTPAQASAALQAVQGMTPPTITAWFDSQRQLACQVTVDMQLGSATSARTDSMEMVMTFTHYGVPVRVTAPAAGDTVSLQQLLQAAGH